MRTTDNGPGKSRSPNKKIQRGNRLLILQNHYHIQIY